MEMRISRGLLLYTHDSGHDFVVRKYKRIGKNRQSVKTMLYTCEANRDKFSKHIPYTMYTSGVRKVRDKRSASKQILIVRNRASSMIVRFFFSPSLARVFFSSVSSTLELPIYILSKQNRRNRFSVHGPAAAAHLRAYIYIGSAVWSGEKKT